MTALNDAVINGIEAMGSYAKSLEQNDFSTNGILFVISDGDDNASKHEVSAIQKVTTDVLRSEALESFISVLVGINLDPVTAQRLDEFNKNANITQFVNIGDATPQKLAKLANFVSKCISSQSQSLDDGSDASKQIQSASLTF
jgi:hypothetical protein